MIITRTERYAFAHMASICRRAQRIVNRTHPRRKTPHGFYDPAGFIENVMARSASEAAYRDIVSRLRDKAIARGTLIVIDGRMMAQKDIEINQGGNES